MAALSRRARITALVLCLTVAACGSASEPESATEESIASEAVSTSPDDRGCAHVIGASVSAAADGTFTISATVASTETGWDKYADRWDVRDPNGAVLGTRVLAHPHVEEQPFTRSLNGVEIPMGVDRVVVAARDSVVGWCGSEFEAAVTR